MDYDTVLQLSMQAMLLCLKVSLPVVAVAALVGLLISFLQAITSLQDQTISQSIKLVAVVVVLLVSAPWGASALMGFARQAMTAAVQ